MPSLLLSDRAVAKLPFQAGGQVDHRDTEVRGFYVRVGARKKTYMAQGDLWEGAKRTTVKLAIGSTNSLTAREARARAKKLIGQIQEGIDPRPKDEAREPEVRGPTLRTAWQNYLKSHLIRKGRAKKTIDSYQDHVERLMADWLDVSIEELGNDPQRVKAKHDSLTEHNGPYIANGCMRTYRAVYRHARKTARHLPSESPVDGVDWNRERRRDSGMGEEDLPKWFGQLRAIDNPLRREFHLLLLLSGSRPEAMKCVEFKHLNLLARALFVPAPKGGEERAFFIPLSRQMVRSIIRAIRVARQMYPRRPDLWLFPADSESGHMSEHKEERSKLSHWSNDLRQTYRTIAQSVGISELDMHLLMNHSVPGVNAGYITRSKLGAHLLAMQQQLTDAMFNASACEAGKGLWPYVGSRELDASVQIATRGWD